jgi:hypothetical protein
MYLVYKNKYWRMFPTKIILTYGYYIQYVENYTVLLGNCTMIVITAFYTNYYIVLTSRIKEFYKKKKLLKNLKLK